MDKLVILLTIIAIQSVLTASVLNDDLVVSLPNGPVRGKSYASPGNKTYYGFRGIPFGAPPVGNLRFEAPQPAQPWTDVLDATKDSKMCVSSLNFLIKFLESEDCLYVNVYTPSLKPEKKLPVLVWIYGGKFDIGSSIKIGFGPDFFIDEDVVYVSFNYRLGPLGFLSTGDSAIVGNAGLKDQSLAIKWVHDNIEYFGGDPEKVTIFGESAGGASVGLQLLNKNLAGLYRAAILESGSALTNWTIDYNPRAYVNLLTTKLGGETYLNDSLEIKKFLQEKSAADIMKAADLLGGHKREGLSSLVDLIPINQAWPVIEVENDNAFLTESPYELLDSGRFNQVPIIIGMCANEAGTFLQDLDYIDNMALQYDSIPETIIPTNLRQNSSDNDAVIQKIRSMYLKDGETFSSNHLALTNIASDNSFTKGQIKHAELTSKYAPVYIYQFAYYGRPLFSYSIPGAEKASHGAEIPFLFHILPTTNAADVLTQNRIVRLWANFAKYLNPTPEKSELIDLIWPTINATNFPFLNINDTLEVRPSVRETYAGWNYIYQTYGKKPLVTF